MLPKRPDHSDRYEVVTEIPRLRERYNTYLLTHWLVFRADPTEGFPGWPAPPFSNFEAT